MKVSALKRLLVVLYLLAVVLNLLNLILLWKRISRMENGEIAL